MQQIALERAQLGLLRQPRQQLRRMRTSVTVPPGVRFRRRSSSWRGGSATCVSAIRWLAFGWSA